MISGMSKREVEGEVIVFWSFEFNEIHDSHMRYDHAIGVRASRSALINMSPPSMPASRSSVIHLRM